jgi:hypothetical protein
MGSDNLNVRPQNVAASPFRGAEPLHILMTVPESEQIAAWDWRWRAPFDPDLANLVRNASLFLAAQEFSAHARVISELLDHALTVASWGGLLSSLEEESNPEARRSMLDVAETIGLNGLPRFLERAALERAQGVASCETELTRLRKLLRVALAARWREPHVAALEIAFGSQLTELVHEGREGRDVARATRPGQAIRTDQVLAEVQQFVDRASTLRPLLAEFSTELRPGEAFGAYWPREMTHSEVDRLDIYANPDSLRANTLEATIAHELAGHGVFYEELRRKPPIFFDHGALGFVEGWATFAEWTFATIPAKTPHWTPLLSLLGADADAARQRMPEIVRSQGMSDAMIEPALFSWTQLPAYQASYSLGALWFSQRAATFDDGVRLLSQTLGGPAGDFFGLW